MSAAKSNTLRRLVGDLLPPITLEKAEELWQRSDYGQGAVEMPGNEINTADAAAFFLEGYEYARRVLQGNAWLKDQGLDGGQDHIANKAISESDSKQ
jgi:hypothetical protein